MTYGVGKQKSLDCMKYLTPMCPELNDPSMDKMKAKDVTVNNEVTFFTADDIQTVDELCEKCKDFHHRKI